MNLADQIREKVMELEDTLYRLPTDNQSFSLMNGRPGFILLQFHLFKATGKAVYRERAAKLISDLLDEFKDLRSFTYCDGLAGIAYLFQYLLTEGFLDDDMETFLQDCDEILIKVLHRMLDQKNLDFLHGATGLAYYLLNRYPKGRITEPAFTGLFNKLKTLVVELINSGAPLNEFITDKDNEPADCYINLGMAHGVVSILLLFTKYYTTIDTSTENYQLIHQLASFLISFESPDERSLSAYPSIVKLSKGTRTTTYNIPLGWCYGDAVISIGLYQAGLALNDTNLTGKGLGLALRTTRRGSRQSSLVRDACFCHGSASLAHIYKKWYAYTGDAQFLVWYNHWISETMTLCNHADGIAGYKKFSGEVYTAEAGLLDGACGVAMVLLDFPHKESNWDSFFLLS